MPSSKKAPHKAIRRQPPRATRDVADKTGRAETGDAISSHPSTGGARKREGKPRGAAARRRSKLQSALLKKVDGRNFQEAWAEQASLLGLNTPSSPNFPAESKLPRTKGPNRRKRTEAKYVDDILNEDNCLGDQLQRGERWIPDFEHRAKPTHQPRGVPYSLWMSYRFLDDFIYRQSLSAAELDTLPLLEDVHEYQNSGGRATKPITPVGYQFDEHLELVPMKKE